MVGSLSSVRDNQRLRPGKSNSFMNRVQNYLFPKLALSHVTPRNIFLEKEEGILRHYLGDMNSGLFVPPDSSPVDQGIAQQLVHPIDATHKLVVIHSRSRFTGRMTTTVMGQLYIASMLR